jgi:hypothetical protein
MPRQVDDGAIAVVVRVGEVKGEAARRFEPLDARRIAVAGQKADAGVPAFVSEPREGRVGMLRLKGHREVGDDDEGLRERHVVDQRNVWQVDPRLGRGAPVAVDRDVADRLERFICQGVLLTRDRIEPRVAGEPGFERAVEIGPPDARQLVVELDRDAAPPWIRRCALIASGLCPESTAPGPGDAPTVLGRRGAASPRTRGCLSRRPQSPGTRAGRRRTRLQGRMDVRFQSSGTFVVATADGNSTVRPRRHWPRDGPLKAETRVRIQLSHHRSHAGFRSISPSVHPLVATVCCHFVAGLARVRPIMTMRHLTNRGSN